VAFARYILTRGSKGREGNEKARGTEQ